MSELSTITALGCSCNRELGDFAPSLLVGRHVLLDAGSFVSRLSLDEQLDIDHVVLSHAHLDHVKDLAQFADLIIGRRKTPVKVHATQSTLDILRNDLFNNRLWPDFFSLPDPEHGVLQQVPFCVGKSFGLGGLRFKAYHVSHPIDCVGFVVTGPTGAFAYSGDTGPTEEFWSAVGRSRKIKLMFVETKFPNEMQMVADAAGHLTPRTLKLQLRKVGHTRVPVVLYHLKPDHRKTIIDQIQGLGDMRIEILEIGRRYAF